MQRRLLVPVLAWLALLAGPAGAGQLASPLDPARWPAGAAAGSPPPCPEAPAPVRDLAAVMYYADAAGSAVDQDRRDENRAIVKPLDEFTRLLLVQSNRFMRTGDARRAACGFGMLHGWAEAGALTGELSLQGQFHRNWATNAFATAYLILSGAVDAEPARDQAVQDWLAELCRLDQQLAERVSNNHLAWSAASCASVAVATDQRALLDWSVGVAEQVLDEVDALGVLPREIGRGERALAYHNFALEALTVVAEMAWPNGADLYAYRDGALPRLADFVIRNAEDPAEAGELAGTPQSWSGATSGRFVWAEPYQRRFDDPRLALLLGRLRPMRHAYFGGDATLMYADATLLPRAPAGDHPE
ncbi:alginate lyase family protein [Geminicoccus roseus]|uniref:alginate lyase family protein n=1 Tax=Geminicoccus roseus TaxID=404900 RepID=UPI0004893563|nr:alginate lyase family protein [Geminicoccus roseus]